MKVVSFIRLASLSLLCSMTAYSSEIPPIISCGPDMETLSPEEIQQNIAELDFHEIQSIKVQSGLSDLEWKKLNGEFSELELLAGSLDYDTPKIIPLDKADNPFSFSFEAKIPVPKTPIDQSFLEDFDSFILGKIDIEALLDGRHCIFEVGASMSCVSEGLFGTYDSPSALDEYNILSGKNTSFLSLTTVSYRELGLSSDDVLALEKTISTGMIARFVKDRECIVKKDAVYCQMSPEERSHPSAEQLKPNRDGWFKVPGTTGSDGNVTSGPKVLSRAERSKLLIGGEELGQRAKYRGEVPGRCYAACHDGSQHDPRKPLKVKREWTLGSVHRAGVKQSSETASNFMVLGGLFSIGASGGNPKLAAEMTGYFVGLAGGFGYVNGAATSLLWQRGDEENVILLPDSHENVGDREDGVDYEKTEEAQSENNSEEAGNNDADDEVSADIVDSPSDSESPVENEDNNLDTNEPDFDARDICISAAEHTGCTFDPTMDNSPKVEDVFCKKRVTPISNAETYDPISELDGDYTKEVEGIRELLELIKNNPRVLTDPDGLPSGAGPKVVYPSLKPGNPKFDPETCGTSGRRCDLEIDLNRRTK